MNLDDIIPDTYYCEVKSYSLYEKLGNNFVHEHIKTITGKQIKEAIRGELKELFGLNVPPGTMEPK